MYAVNVFLLSILSSSCIRILNWLYDRYSPLAVRCSSGVDSHGQGYAGLGGLQVRFSAELCWPSNRFGRAGQSYLLGAPVHRQWLSKEVCVLSLLGAYSIVDVVDISNHHNISEDHDILQHINIPYIKKFSSL